MAGLMSRASAIVKAKISKLLDHAEDPAETLDYSYERQLELLQNVKRGIADVVTAKKRLELQETQLEQSVVKLDVAGPRGAGGQPGGSRPPGARAQVGPPAAAPEPRHAGEAARGAAGEARGQREGALGQGRGVPHAEGDDQGPVLGRRGAGEDRRGGDRDRRGDGRHGARDPAREGQDRADAGARIGDRRADHLRRARGLHVRPDRARPRARRARLPVAGGQGAGRDEGGGRLRRAAEGAQEVIVRLMGEGRFEVDDEVAKGLNDIDDQAGAAVERGDEAELTALLRRMAEAVRTNGVARPGRGPVGLRGDHPARRPLARRGAPPVRGRGPDPGPPRRASAALHRRAMREPVGFHAATRVLSVRVLATV